MITPEGGLAQGPRNTQPRTSRRKSPTGRLVVRRRAGLRLSLPHFVGATRTRFPPVSYDLSAGGFRQRPLPTPRRRCVVWLPLVSANYSGLHVPAIHRGV